MRGGGGREFLNIKVNSKFICKFMVISLVLYKNLRGIVYGGGGGYEIAREGACAGRHWEFEEFV